MACYHFVTAFRVAASRERVWEVLSDVAQWPSWWRWLRRVDALAEGDADGVGARHRCAFRTALPYTLTFDAEVRAVSPPTSIELRVRGELAGAGVWELAAADGGSWLRYTWIVATTRRWMNVLAPVAGPAFAWNHHVLMRDFARGLAARLAVESPTVDTRRLKPTSPRFGVLPGRAPR